MTFVRQLVIMLLLLMKLFFMDVHILYHTPIIVLLIVGLWVIAVRTSDSKRMERSLLCLNPEGDEVGLMSLRSNVLLTRTECVLQRRRS